MLKTYYFVGLSFLLITIGFVQCDTDYVFDIEANGWLKLYSSPATWTEAFLKCHNEGSVLASPLNKELAKALRSLIVQLQGSDIYLGIHDLHSKGLLASVEGMPLSAMNLKLDSQNNEEANRDCLSMDPNARVHQADAGNCLTMSADGSVHYSSCTDPLPFICYKLVDSDCDHEYQYNQHTGRCYKVHTVEQHWTRAYEICACEGGHLVILNDEEEANFVRSLFPVYEGNSREQFHLGLRAWGADRIWTTIHGDSINHVFNRWNTSQPDNMYGTQDRATFLKNGYMDDVQPWAVAMFVCEKSKNYGYS